MKRMTTRRLVKLARIACRPAYALAGLRGVMAAIEHEAALRLLPPIQSVLDVGAHCGQFSLVAKRFFPRAALYAFEPQARACQKYRTTLGRHATLFPYAIGPMSGLRSMHVPQYTGAASMLPLAQAQFAMFPETGVAHLEEVQMRRIDDLLRVETLARPSLLKIDVQGYELEVLRSMASRLDAIDFLIVEAGYVACYEGQPLIDEIRLYLRQTGFQISAERNPLYGSNGALAQMDIVACRH